MWRVVAAPRKRFAPTAGAAGTVVNQPHFRIRSDDTQTLNADAGWAAALDTNATIDAEKVFRVRFEIEETAGGSFSSALKLQYRKNGGTWTDVADRAVAENVQTATNPIEGVLSGQYADGDATTNILSGSAQSFTGGTGEEGPATGTKTLQSQHTELEWALRMRVMYHDGTNKGRATDGDTFELRIVESGGAVLSGSYTNPTVTLNVPDYLIGATSIETPKRMGPFIDSNGNLYYYVEYSEPNASDEPAMLKSTDGGKQWSIVDAANAPDAADGADDNESIDIQQVGSVLHIGGFHASNRVRYHTFRMSDNASPDTWGVVSQVVDDPTSPTDQDVSIGVRSDGSVICAYQTAGATVGYRIRSTGGTWGSETILDTTASVTFSSCIIVIGESDLAYFIYKDHTNNIVYYKTLDTGGTLSGRTQFNASGTVPQIKAIPTAYYFDDGGDEVIVAFFRRGSNMIERRIINGSLQTERTISDAAIAINQNGSGAPEAALAVWGDDIHAAWVDSTDTSLVKYDTSQDAAAYSTDVTKYDSAITGLSIQGAKVYRHSAGNGGALVMAVVVDEGDGLSGGNWYVEWTVSETAAADATATPSTVAAVASIPSPTVLAAAIASPSTVAAGASVPSPTVSGTAITSPSTVAAIAAVPSPTVAGAARVEPSTVAAVASIPAPSISVGTNATATPSTVAAVASVPAPTALASAITAPSTVAATASVPAPTVRGTAITAPSTVSAVSAVPSPTVLATAIVSPVTVAAVAAVPSPSVSVGGNATPSVSTVVALAAVPAPTVLATAIVAVSTVAAVSAVPSPAVLAAAVTAPSSVSAVASVPSPTVRGTAIVSPATVAAIAAVPSPAVLVGGSATAQPAAVVAVASIPGVSVLATARVSPATVVGTASVPAPTLRSDRTAIPATVAAVVAVPGPTVRGTALVAVSTVVAVASVPSPNVFGGTQAAPIKPWTGASPVSSRNDSEAGTGAPRVLVGTSRNRAEVG